MASIIQIRRDTASDWTSANPTLAQGELGLETDTLKLKAGDGTTAWTSLAYYSLGTAGYLATSTIGSTVQAFDANTAKLDESANFTGTLQNGGSNVVVDSDIGTTVLAPNGDGSSLTGISSLPSQTSQSGKFLTTNGSAASWGVAGGGKILQVISFVDTGYATVASNTFTSVPLLVAITPSATTSKILVMVSGGTISPVSAAGGVSLKIYRGSTALNAASSNQNYAGGSVACPASITYLDSPSTTSATTYQLYMKEDNGNAIYYNYYGEADMTITVMEIGA